MQYNKLVSITGYSGLFELISSKADGGIVRSLEDNTTRFVSTRVHQFSHIESVEVYTIKENVNLADVFTAMKSSSEKLPDPNDAAAVKSYLSIVYPEMDFGRVYGSDMKKMVKWFAQLEKHQVEIVRSENTPESEGPVHEQAASKPKAAESKSVSTRTAPPKKINTPRKMA